DTDNLLLVCGKHHRMHHRGRLDITGDADRPDGLEFRNQHGQIYFNPPRTYYDDLRQRMRTDTEYLAKIQPPGLH
ncbi:MAG: hypothetical protein O3B90_11700, partial [Actinomycetota bacterium]|nr:hypothetical protein [Actinomycetota bacterium]